MNNTLLHLDKIINLLTEKLEDGHHIRSLLKSEFVNYELNEEDFLHANETSVHWRILKTKILQCKMFSDDIRDDSLSTLVAQATDKQRDVLIFIIYLAILTSSLDSDSITGAVFDAFPRDKWNLLLTAIEFGSANKIAFY